jgi:hypothetical protein
VSDDRIHMEEWRKAPLYMLLNRRLTWMRSKVQTKILDVHKLAEALGYSHEAIYKWFRAGKLSPKGAKALVKVSRKKLALRDLYPFVVV